MNSAADLEFNFRGCAMSPIREYKWNWEFGGGGHSVPQKLMHSELFEDEEEMLRIPTVKYIL